MFDYIKFDAGALRILVCIIIFLGLWYITRFLRKTSCVFNVVMLYTLVGFISALIFYSLSQNSWYYFNEADINYQPLIYLIILFFVLTLPFGLVNIRKIKDFDDTGILPYLNVIATVIFILSIFPFINGLISLSSINYSKIVAAYEGDAGGSSSFVYYSNHARYYLKFFISPLFFYYLYKGHSYKKYFRYMAFALFTTMLTAFTGGGRGTLVNELNYLIICYLLFYNLIDSQTKNKIRRIGFIIFISTIVGLTAITFARTGFKGAGASNQEKVGLATVISLYLGQGPLEFSRQMYPSTVRTEGDNSFSLVKVALGKKTFKDNNERREYWENKQTIQNFIFYTLVGDIYSDLGFIYTILFCILISVVLGVYFYRKRGKPLTIQMVVITSIYFEWITMGFMNNCYKTYYQQFYIFVTFIILLLLSALRKNKITRI